MDIPEFPKFERSVKIAACKEYGCLWCEYGSHEVIPQRVTVFEIDELRRIAWRLSQTG